MAKYYSYTSNSPKAEQYIRDLVQEMEVEYEEVKNGEVVRFDIELNDFDKKFLDIMLRDAAKYGIFD